MAFPTITTTQQFQVSIAPVDRKNHPAPIEPGSVVWASSNEAVASIVKDASDETKAVVVAQGGGDYMISVSADADLGSGVETINGSDTGSVSLAKATSVGLVVGPITEQA